MSIQSEINRIKTDKETLITNLKEKGIEIADGTTLGEISIVVEETEELANTSDATANASDILFGKTAYIANGKTTGTIETFDGSFECSSDSTGGENQPALINFTIQYGLSNNLLTMNCIAEEGMTFGEWIFSEYGNTLENYINKFYIEGYFIFCTNNSGTNLEIKLNGTNVSVLDSIQPDCIYTSISEVSECCFISGTQILISLDGQTKNIEDIKIGENIVSYNINTGENYLAEVIKVITHENTTDIAEVIFDNKKSLIMNSYHPLYCENGFKSITKYKGYDELIVGDRVKTIDGWTKITEINRYKSEAIITYNLDVRDKNEILDMDTNDTYYANGIVVHNGFC